MDSCRTCLREAIADRGYGIFYPDVRPVTDLLIASTSLKIFENDGLPTRICEDCFSKLSTFHAFCRLSIESDLIFRQNHYIKVELDDEGTEPITNKLTPDASITSTHHIDIPVVAKPAAATTVFADKRPAPIKSKSKWILDNDDGDDDRTADDDDAAAVDDDDDDYQPPVGNKTQKHLPKLSTDTKKDSTPNMSHPLQKSGQRKRPFAPRPGARTADKSNKFTCDECGKNYYEKERLAGHLRQHFGLRPFPCDRCPKEYDKYSKLRAHQMVHAPSPEKMTMCPHEGCGKSFKLPRYAQDHYERIHLGLRPKVRVDCMCDTCGKSFMNRSNLLQHIKSHMDVEQYPFQCDVCEKRFLTKYIHNLHVLRHQNVRNFPCPLCPARMVSQLEVKTHISQVHDKSVSWSCPECPAVYYRKAHLRAHELKVHRGYKPHVCRFCNRPFGTKPLLVKHERLHTGEKPFACPICDRRFAQETHMKSHVKTHNKRKDDSR